MLLLLVFWETDEEDVGATKERDVLLVVCWAADAEDVGATKADDVDAEEATAARARAREVLLRLVVILLKNNAGLVSSYLLAIAITRHVQNATKRSTSTKSFRDIWSRHGNTSDVRTSLHVNSYVDVAVHRIPASDIFVD